MKTTTMLLITVLIGFSAKTQNIFDWYNWQDQWRAISGTVTVMDHSPLWQGSYLRIENSGQVALTSIPDNRSAPGRWVWGVISFTYQSNSEISVTIRTSAMCGQCFALLPPVDHPTHVSVPFYVNRIYAIMFYNRMGRNQPYLELDNLIVN